MLEPIPVSPLRSLIVDFPQTTAVNTAGIWIHANILIHRRFVFTIIRHIS